MDNSKLTTRGNKLADLYQKLAEANKNRQITVAPGVTTNAGGDLVLKAHVEFGRLAGDDVEWVTAEADIILVKSYLQHAAERATTNKRRWSQNGVAKVRITEADAKPISRETTAK